MSETTQVTRTRTQIRIVLIDDDQDFGELAATFLERNGDGFAVEAYTDPERALETIKSEPVDAVVSDYRMPEQTGLDLLGRIRETDPWLPFFLFTGYGSEEVASEAISAGVTDYLRKEAGSDQYVVLANRIENAVEKRRAEQSLRENEQFLQSVFDGIRNGLAVVDNDLNILRVNQWLAERVSEPLTGRKCYEALRGEPSQPDICPVQKALDTGERQQLETELRHLGDPFFAELHTDPLPPDSDGDPRVLIEIQDISARKRRERKLEKRERLFRALHDQTKNCLAASSPDEIFGEIVSSMAETLAYAGVAVLAYDTDTGTLQPGDRTATFTDRLGDLDPVRPGSGPLWQPFQDDHMAVIEATEIASVFEQEPSADSDFVAVPLGDHGLIVVHRVESVAYPEIDVELMNLCAASAGAILDRIQKQGQLGTAHDRMTAQADQIENLRGFLQAIQRIHSEIAEAETRSAIERALVGALVETDVVDFAWIGRPEAGDTNLSPAVWDGRDTGYLDTLDLDPQTELVPAQQAARDRSPVAIPNIAEHVQGSPWAKAALSRDFQSVSAFPIEYDGVLYGVLSVYSGEADMFDSASDALLSDVTALVAAHIGVQNVRIGEAEPASRELEFAVTDSNHPLYTLAKQTGVTVRFKMILEALEETVRIVVSVPPDTPDSFLEEARTITSVLDASWFGDPADRSVLLEVDQPFIGTGVARHGGTLRAAVADGETATVTIGVPASIEVRPLIEWIKHTYRDVELIAKRDPQTNEGAELADPTSHLTERQAEVLKAAYVGGYFENPRKITGEELAESFDISGSAVYKHLRAAQKRLLDHSFDIDTEE